MAELGGCFTHGPLNDVDFHKTWQDATSRLLSLSLNSFLSKHPKAVYLRAELFTPSHQIDLRNESETRQPNPAIFSHHKARHGAGTSWKYATMTLYYSLVSFQYTPYLSHNTSPNNPASPTTTLHTSQHAFSHLRSGLSLQPIYLSRQAND